MRSRMEMPQRIADFGSPWIAVDNFCNCILLFIIMSGLGFFKVYEKWKEEAERENALSYSLRRYIRDVRDRLNPDYIISRLDGIIVVMGESPETGRRDIMDFCGWLRGQLYELPRPATPPADPKIAVPDGAARFFINPGMRLWRNVAFQALLLTISFGVFFNTPDSTDFSADCQMSFWGMYAFLNVVAYTVILLLYPRLRRSGNVRRFVAGAAVLTGVLVVPMVLIQLFTYDVSPYSGQVPFAMMVLSTLGSATTIALFIGGICAALMMGNWLRSRRRSMLLLSEHTRQEYAFLRKQINPHFLFNVLNNAGILSDENPAESMAMLRELRRLLLYQFDETSEASTPLADEIDFLRSYLTLQASRIEPFSFSVRTVGEIDNVEVPTLIFITFVENAVKHSTVVSGRRNVEVLFNAGAEGLEFICRNTYRRAPSASERPGGVGLANTRRRLDLLYGERAKLSSDEADGLYSVKLFMPYDCLSLEVV